MRRTRSALLRAAEIFFILIWLFPLVWMLITSLKAESEVVTRTFTFWPQHPTIANYTKAFTSTYILNWLLNSLIVSAMAMLLTLIVDAPIAYALSLIHI